MSPLHRRRLTAAAALAATLLGATLVSAQAPATPESPEPVATSPPVATPVAAPAPSPVVVFASTADELAAFEAWRRALDATPALVSLGSADEAPDDEDALADFLRHRLKLLSRKMVSNRQWRDYWKEQGTTATALMKLYRAQPDDAARAVRADVLQRWSDLASAKTKNQDAYLEAVENERDALEERLAGVLHPAGSEEVVEEGAKPVVDAKPNAFTRRRHWLASLRRRKAEQIEKRGAAEQQKLLVQRQGDAQKLTQKALQKDVDLATKELTIAEHAMADVGGEWGEVWEAVAGAARNKVASLEREVSLGEQRIRSLEVEVSLLDSQIRYREEKAASLGTKLEEDSSVGGWFEAIRDTVVEWLKVNGWQVALALLLIFLGMKIALRILGTLVRVALKAVEDDDPDTTSQEEARAQTIASVVEGVLRIAVWTVGGLIALDTVGVNTGPILGSVAILGLAISFGSQNLVRDVVNGFFILVENQFAVGDVVRIGGTTGTIEEINLRSTRIREYSGTLHVLPNGHISAVANLTRDWARAIVDVGVAYGTDIGSVERVVREVAEALVADEDWKERLLELPSFVGVTRLDDSAVMVRVVVKTDPGDQWAVDRELKRRFHDAFGAAGIEIPFPQQVVWHRDAEAAAAAAPEADA